MFGRSSQPDPGGRIAGPRKGWGTRPWTSPAALLMLGLLVGASACDGRNFFQPVTEPPTVVDLFAPASVSLGSSLAVNVRAVGIIEIDSIVVTLDGAYETRVVVEGEPGEIDMIRELSIPIPSSLDGSTFVVRAIAFDVQENESSPRSRVVSLVDGIPPTVTGQLQSSTVEQTGTVRVSVTATDNVELLLTGMRVREPGGNVIFNDIRPTSGASAQEIFEWDVPGDQAPGPYAVQAYADDASNNRTVHDVGQVTVEFRDQVPPEVTIETPVNGQVVTLGDSVFVRVHVQDEGGFRNVRIQGVAFRGDPDLGTDVTVTRFTPWNIQLNEAVTDTTLTRYLQPSGPGPAEPVFVIVTATDLNGNEGTDTVVIDLREEETEGTN